MIECKMFVMNYAKNNNTYWNVNKTFALQNCFSVVLDAGSFGKQLMNHRHFKAQELERC